VTTVYPDISLTPRQVDVMLYSSNGFTIKEIAAKKGVTVKTIQGIKQCIMKKFGARTWPQALSDAFRMYKIE
jgi:DNA-binding NarL/FixJ family response regulator